MNISLFPYHLSNKLSFVLLIGCFDDILRVNIQWCSTSQWICERKNKNNTPHPSVLENLEQHLNGNEGLENSIFLFSFPSPAAAASAKSLQSCLTPCGPIEGSPPGSAVPGILQARTLEWVAIAFSSGSSQPKDQTQVSHIAGGFFYQLSHKGRVSLKICLRVHSLRVNMLLNGQH